MRERAVLRCVENDRVINERQDADFLYLLQSSILLALKESGLINEIQCRYAEDALKAQRRDHAAR